MLPLNLVTTLSNSSRKIKIFQQIHAHVSKMMTSALARAKTKPGNASTMSICGVRTTKHLQSVAICKDPN